MRLLLQTARGITLMFLQNLIALLAIILFVSKFNKTVLIENAVGFKERFAAVELLQFKRCMFTFLHRPCKFDSSTGDDINVRFKPYGVDAKPARMTFTVPVAGFLTT